MSNKPDGRKKNQNGKSRDKRVVAPKHHGPKPDFTPRAIRLEKEARDRAIKCEGFPETKEALAAGKAGLYYYCGEFFRISEFKKENERGAVAYTEVKDEKGNHIPHNWLMIPEHKWETKELIGSEERKNATRSLRKKLLEYAGPEIQAAKAAYVKMKIEAEAKERRQASEAKAKEAEAAIIASASDDPVGMFHQQKDGIFKVPGGLVVKVSDGKAEVLVGNGDVTPGGWGKHSFFLHMGTLSKEQVHMNGKIRDEKFRTELYTWQTKLHAVLKAARAATPAPVAVEKVSQSAKAPIAMMAAAPAAKAPVATMEAVVVRIKSAKVATPVTQKLDVPPMKEAKRLDAAALLSMTPKTKGLHFILEKGGRAYLLADHGRWWLIAKTESFPKDHLLARVLALHSDKEYRTDKLVFVDIHAIRQEQSTEELANLVFIKNARRAVQRYLRKMLLDAESKHQNGHDAIGLPKPEVTPGYNPLAALSKLKNESSVVH